MTEKDFKPSGAIWLFIILVLAVFAGSIIYFKRNNPAPVISNQALSSYPANIRQPRTYTVFYGLGVFSPTNLRIHVGDSVRFQNDSNNPMHVISDSNNGVIDLAGFDSASDVPPKSVFIYTFSQTGIFDYHNVHNDAEEGTVIVRQ